MSLLPPASPHRTVRRRDPCYRLVTRLLSIAALPVAFVVAPGRARHVACRWALALRFPAENLDGLTPDTLAAFEAARTEALWCHGELIGLTAGYRDARTQARLLADTVRRTGSLELAPRRTLPPHSGMNAPTSRPPAVLAGMAGSLILLVASSPATGGALPPLLEGPGLEGGNRVPSGPQQHWFSAFGSRKGAGLVARLYGGRA